MGDSTPLVLKNGEGRQASSLGSCSVSPYLPDVASPLSTAIHRMHCHLSRRTNDEAELDQGGDGPAEQQNPSVPRVRRPGEAAQGAPVHVQQGGEDGPARVSRSRHVQ